MSPTSKRQSSDGLVISYRNVKSFLLRFKIHHTGGMGLPWLPPIFPRACAVNCMPGPWKVLHFSWLRPRTVNIFWEWADTGRKGDGRASHMGKTPTEAQNYTEHKHQGKRWGRSTRPRPKVSEEGAESTEVEGINVVPRKEPVISLWGQRTSRVVILPLVKTHTPSHIHLETNWHLANFPKPLATITENLYPSPLPRVRERTWKIKHLQSPMALSCGKATHELTWVSWEWFPKNRKETTLASLH